MTDYEYLFSTNLHAKLKERIQESDQAVEEKRFAQPFPWIKEDVVYCDNCEHFHDCLNKGGLTDVTISDDITEGRYIKKPRYDCPKEKE